MIYLLLRCEKSYYFGNLSTMMSKKMIGHSNQLVTFLSAFATDYFVFGTNNKLNIQVSVSTTSTAVVRYYTCISLIWAKVTTRATSSDCKFY